MDQTPTLGQLASPQSTAVSLPQTSSQSSTFADAKVELSQTPAMTGGGAGHPEVKAGPVINPEVVEIEVIPESPEISPELAEHVERVVRGEVQLPGPIEAGIHEGRPVNIQPSVTQQPNIVLPLTRGDFTAGPNQPVSSSWRWLYEFVRRIILMMPGRAVYRENYGSD